MAQSPGELIIKVETMKNGLVAIATGGAMTLQDYQHLRSELVSDSLLREKLPQFLHTCRTPKEFWGFIQPQHAHYAQRREFLRQVFDPLLSWLKRAAVSPLDDTTTTAIGQVDSTYVQGAWSKALERRTSDPEGAITAARSLVETMCKHILDEMNVGYTEDDDLPKLYYTVACKLNLSPGQHTEELFKRTLGSCQQVVQCLAEIRNKMGDAHGKGVRHVKPAPRHAELAINLAGAMATFLIETWESHQRT
jgi:hypothetical protein